MRKFRRPAGGLWANHDFIRLWSGQSISELGSQVSQLAIPIVAAISLHASPIVFSLLAVFGFLPFILFALPAGAWVDRMRRRRILIVGDASRALLLATIPLAYWLGVLSIWQLLVIQFVVGVFTVFFDVAYQSYLPQLVHRDHLIEGNSKLQLSVSVAQVAGPSMGGGLIAALTAPYAILADAVSFVVSTVFLFRIRTEDAARAHRGIAEAAHVARGEGRPQLGRSESLPAADRGVHGHVEPVRKHGLRDLRSLCAARAAPRAMGNRFCLRSRLGRRDHRRGASSIASR